MNKSSQFEDLRTPEQKHRDNLKILWNIENDIATYQELIESLEKSKKCIVENLKGYDFTEYNKFKELNNHFRKNFDFK
jgi:hypothetical protein